MDLTRLRDVLEPNIVALQFYGHRQLPAICEELGLPVPPRHGPRRKKTSSIFEESRADTPEDMWELTKAERLRSSFNAVPDADLRHVAECFLERHNPAPSVRNEIQDLLWADVAVPEIPKRFRRELARALTMDTLYRDVQQFDALLDKLWICEPLPAYIHFSHSGRSIDGVVARNVHSKPGSNSVEELFETLGAFNASDRRFALFLEGLASSDVRPDEAAQRHFVQLVNGHLSGCGVELRESEQRDGYPVFTVVSKHSAQHGRPKNLIFASSVKPDLRFRDAVSNTIEIVTNRDKVLVYDRPISNDGIRWRDLQAWWRELRGIADERQAKVTLYQRLEECLPASSPPQRNLFHAFYRGFGKDVPGLPALLPEVWLHWDPKTVKERGPDALTRSRMDFLLLLPEGIRVVIEVDGEHHYAREDGKADCDRYAAMVAADRDLKLAGYQVFRFGAKELKGDSAPKLVKHFFETLFRRYKI